MGTTDNRPSYPGNPGDVWQDDDGYCFVLFPDGKFRLIENDAEPIDPHDDVVLSGPDLIPVIIAGRAV